MKCVYCGREEEVFRGINFIHNDGTVSYFCSGKCRKNAMKLKRDKKRQKWTEAYSIARAKTEAKARSQ